MTTIAATSSINFASPVRGIAPAHNRESQSTTEALQELTRAAHRAISVAGNVATTVAPLAGASASLAAALWNMDSGASAPTGANAEVAASAQPDMASLESQILKALAQALGVNEAA
ncbi:hypothetical protein JNB84_08250 [Rhizobium pusense]|uniref:hypothetical protein n=1 Tax=Agrobacterium pusense TaxID=648995 RepID=UPI00142EEFE2|nr:hypothetical protein [Agrobacterium pusense]MBW9077932.1 hypothetical protein [Agrobacterium pusense]MDH0113020.1 hypothetical protein [Agrobacterium pusense]